MRYWKCILLALAAMALSSQPILSAAQSTTPGALKVFILAGQSNMDGQASAKTIDFLGEDQDPARAALLKVFKPDGMNFVAPEEQAMLQRATSNLGFHYFGEGRFFILLGKSFADTMLELMKNK